MSGTKYIFFVIKFAPPHSQANLNCSWLSSIFRFGTRSPTFRYGQLASTSFCAIIGTTLFPIRATCFDFGYGFQL